MCIRDRGASQDIKTATETARAMVTEYGMSDAVGLINYTSGSDEVFIGRDTVSYTHLFSARHTP